MNLLTVVWVIVSVYNGYQVWVASCRFYNVEISLLVMMSNIHPRGELSLWMEELCQVWENNRDDFISAWTRRFYNKSDLHSGDDHSPGKQNLKAWTHRIWNSKLQNTFIPMALVSSDDPHGKCKGAVGAAVTEVMVRLSIVCCHYVTKLVTLTYL